MVVLRAHRRGPAVRRSTAGAPTRRARRRRPEQVLLDENDSRPAHDYFALGAFDASARPHACSPTRADSDGGERTRCASATSTHGDDLADVIAGRTTASAWASRRPHVLLRPCPTTPCGRTRCGATRSARRRATTCSCTRRTTSASSSASASTQRRAVPRASTSSSKVTERGAVLDADDPTGDVHASSSRARQDVEYARRPPRRPLPHRHQRRRRRELQAGRRRPVDDAGPRALDRGRRPPRRREARRRRRVRRPPRARASGPTASSRLRVAARSTTGDEPRARACPSRCTPPGSAPTPSSTPPTLRFGYTSLVTPPHGVRLRPRHAASATLRQAAAGARRLRPGRLRDRRGCGRPRADGTRVPISLVHRSDIAARRHRARRCSTATAPTRSSIDPSFSSLRLSLLDRGFVFAIAHIRGGGELGRRWYERRQAAAQAQHVHRLHRLRRAPRRRRAARAPDRLVDPRRQRRRAARWARSSNLRPDLFARGRRRGAVRRRASPRCSTPTLPLTVTEWEEWGNPRRRRRRTTTT